jgi:hypothetical protein
MFSKTFKVSLHPLNSFFNRDKKNAFAVTDPAAPHGSTWPYGL